MPMSDPTPEPSVAQLSAKMNDVIFAIKVALCLLLLSTSVSNILASQEIETYRQIFRDALPGKPLPMMTLVVFSASFLLRVLAFAWPVAGITIVILSKRPRYWIIAASIFLVLIGLQSIITWVSFLLPMNGLILGMDDAPSK